MATYTFGNMQDRISTEIEESAHANVSIAEVKSAIWSAIEHYETERLWFNEKSATFSASSSVASIAAPTDLILLTQPVQLISNTIAYELLQVTYSDYLADSAVSSSTGQPTEYAYWGDRIYLWPVPNANFPLIFHYNYRLASLTATAQSSAWTSECERVIRARAKWDIYANLLKFPELATAQKQIEIDAYGELLSHSTRRTTTGKLKASYL